MRRREFLKVAGAASAVSLAEGALAQSSGDYAIVIDARDHAAGSPPVQWAADQLRSALAAKGRLCQVVSSADAIRRAAFYIFVAGPGSAWAKDFPQASGGLSAPESLRLTPGRFSGAPAIMVSGSDVRGYVYGLLELAERVRFGPDAAAELDLTTSIEEMPANEIRSVSRYFSSEIEDKVWLYDKEFWTGYLDLLAASRFNRFCLAFGLEYDFPASVTSDYLHFAYPYLVEVPGYDVRVMQLAMPDGKVLASPVPLSADERKKNFDVLRFVAAQTAARGLHFQLGIWTHAYEWIGSPHAYHRIEGLTPETHVAYCRDALAILLKECPEIQGLTLRVHGESGIPEGNYGFWQTLFEAIQRCGRTVEIDMHAKGVDQKMIDIAVKTGMPVKLGAKYSAEHQSLGYQQADIRALEIPKTGQGGKGPFSLSSGARSFTRYGYADFLQAGTSYKMLFRLFPGTQRHLLSADPEMAAAYGRTAHFCGAVGLDLMEPLTFKGREGSGHAGGRCAYADAALDPKFDWEKFELYYRVWGRKLYDPEANAEAWRRWLRGHFGAAAISIETAVGNASRVLPLLSSAHLPSAAHHSFWPEIYTNMPIVVGSEPSPYSDTPEPKSFGTVSPLDPQLFCTIAEYAADLLAAVSSPKYSPVEAAQWIEDCANASSATLADARRRTTALDSPAFRRIEADIEIQIGLGRFFAAKLRSGVLFAIFEQSRDPQAGMLALDRYRLARESWAAMANRAAVYRSDISYGSTPIRRGHWSDRLAAIDKDIEAMTAQVTAAPRSGTFTPNTERAIGAATARPVRTSMRCLHAPPEIFQPGAPLALSLSVPNYRGLNAVRLHYRHVDQAERWLQMDMPASAGSFAAEIPGEYTQSPFALQYYFELRANSGDMWLYPAFNATLSNQPYYAVQRRSA